MTVRDFLASLVRTVVPVVAGLILSSLAKLGVDVEPGLVSGLVDTVAVAGYYAAVRFAERKWPAVGVLLGWKAQPSYQASKTSA